LITTSDKLPPAQINVVCTDFQKAFDGITQSYFKYFKPSVTMNRLWVPSNLTHKKDNDAYYKKIFAFEYTNVNWGPTEFKSSFPVFRGLLVWKTPYAMSFFSSPWTFLMYELYFSHSKTSPGEWYGRKILKKFQMFLLVRPSD